MCNATELRAVDLSSSHQFEEVIGAASSENWLFIPQMEFSAQTVFDLWHKYLRHQRSNVIIERRGQHRKTEHEGRASAGSMYVIIVAAVINSFVKVKGPLTHNHPIQIGSSSIGINFTNGVRTPSVRAWS
jgi:hypothetical protein